MVEVCNCRSRYRAWWVVLWSDECGLGRMENPMQWGKGWKV